MLYSAMTGGFYVAGLHKQIPADAVEITAEQHRSMLQAEVEGVPIKDRSPSLSLDQVRERKISEIDAARDAALEAGFLFDGMRYDCDDLSVQRITGAAVLGILNPAFETPWITFDNSVVTLSASDLAGLGAAAAQHVATQLFRARGLKDAALAATTVEQIDAINW